MKSEWVRGTDEDRRRFAAALALLPLDKPIVVKLKLFVARHTTAQRRTYFWRLNCLAKFLSEASRKPLSGAVRYSAEDMHEYLKARFCPVKPLNVMGFTIAVRSTKALNKAEMGDMIMNAEVWAAEEFGYEMPEPIPHNVREEIPA